MTEDRRQPMSSGEAYVGRLAAHGVVLCVASVVGSLLNRVYGNWGDIGPRVALYVAVLSLGPAVATVAVAELAGRARLVVHLLIAGAMLGMWWLFSSNDSSTSSFVFIYGWFIGIPVALTIVVATSLRSPRRTGPAHYSSPRDR